jgi:hypothetical protein
MPAVRLVAAVLTAAAIVLAPRAAFASESQLAQGTFDFAVVAVTSVHSADGNLLPVMSLAQWTRSSGS